jgi:hypothetical protein
MSAGEFLVASAEGGCRLAFRGQIPPVAAAYDGYDVLVQLSGGGVEASERVWDHMPQNWSRFFQAMAESWRGWDGERVIESLEGQLRLSCTTDRLGHVAVRVHLRGDMGGSDWRAEDTVYVEAGQLEDIARRAQQYFG